MVLKIEGIWVGEAVLDDGKKALSNHMDWYSQLLLSYNKE